MRTYTVYALLFAIILTTGCATRYEPKEGDVGQIFNPDYQTPNFSLISYKSPELRSESQNKSLSVAVAISGGGHRAGNFGVAVLSELENLNCGGTSYNALKEVDYLSTVSGGGISAGVYLSTLYDHIQKNGNSDNYSLRKVIDANQDNIKTNLKRSYHGILESGLVSLESLGNNDRGGFLEEEFDKKLLGAENRNGKSLLLGDVFISKSNGNNPTLPIWVTNASVYENGSIFPFYPASFERYKISAYTHYLENQAVKDDYSRIPLSVGLKASASFPGAVPATTLTSTSDPDNPYLHLFDGGLSDNLGVTTALRMLAETGENEKVLIIIDAYVGQPEPFSKQEGSPLAVQIWLRSTNISLDAWRIRHRWITDQLSSSEIYNGKKVQVIYLSFDALKEDKEMKKLKDAVYKIGTNFNISTEKQKDLFAAAEYIVKEKKNEIMRKIFDKACP